jgi:hypothetical protein
MTPVATFEPCNVNVRIKVSALWTSMLFVFAVLLAAVVYYAWTWPRRGAS